jgi:protein-tyrosine phosphatase
MAEAIARRRIEELGWTQVEVASAGVGAFSGSPASRGALRAAAANGLDLSGHEATLLTRGLADEADLILTMSEAHLGRVADFGAGERAALVTAFASAGDEHTGRGGVPDPIGGSDEEYERTFRVLEDLVERALDRLAAVVSP